MMHVNPWNMTATILRIAMTCICPAAFIFLSTAQNLRTELAGCPNGVVTCSDPARGGVLAQVHAAAAVKHRLGGHCEFPLSAGAVAEAETTCAWSILITATKH